MKKNIILLAIIVLVIFAPTLIPVTYSRDISSNMVEKIAKTDDSSESIVVSQIKEVIYTKSSWYGDAFHGRKMANGNIFNMHDPTIVAHKTLPFGTKLRIQNLANGKSVECIVQDRGPYAKGRGLDLSYAAAKVIGIDKAGVGNVKVEVFQKG